MKILEVILELEKKSGAEAFVMSLSDSINKSGNDVIVVSLWSNVDQAIRDFFSFKNIGLKTCDKKKGFDLKAAKKLREIIEEFEPDIIHMHLSVMPTYFLAYGLKQKPWNLVFTCHNIAEKETNKYSSRLRKMYFKRNMLYGVGISPKITNTIYKFYGNDVKAFTIYNGIDIKNHGLINNDKKYDLVMSARFNSVKNHIFLLEVIKELREKYNKTVSLICLGDGPTFTHCQRFVQENNLNSQIHFAGQVNDPYPYYLMSKIMILPSLYEGNPISILEGMDCGLPIVATKVGGIPDVIKDGENGLLFDVNNKESCFDMILKLLSDSDLYAYISKKNLSDVNLYSIETVCNEYLSLFRKINNEPLIINNEKKHK